MPRRGGKMMPGPQGPLTLPTSGFRAGRAAGALRYTAHHHHLARAAWSRAG